MKKWLQGILLLSILLIIVGCSQTEGATSSNETEGEKSTEDLVIRIGVQGSGGLFGKAQEDQLFEKAFESYGTTVEWVEFQSGPPMTEAMASGKLDFAFLGNMPVISAQAANIPFKIISQALEGKKNVGVITAKDSGIETLEDLKGKKVAVGKGTNAYDFILRAFEKDGIDATEVELINLNPDEAQAAFDSDGVDAWVTWEPYLSINTLNEKGTIIADGSTHDILSPSYHIVRTDFANDNGDLVVVYLKTLNELLQWEVDNEVEADKRYADERNLTAELMKSVRERSTYISKPVSDEVIEEHQKTADFQYKIGTIRQQIDVKEVFDNQYIEEALK